MSTLLGLRRRELGLHGVLRTGQAPELRSIGYGLAELRRLGLVRGKRRGMLAHAGCVNCVSWSPDGDLLLTGSDDRKIKVWDSRNVHDMDLAACLQTNHHSNIFDAQFVPGSGCSMVVSCARTGTLYLNHIETPTDIALLDNFDQPISQTIFGFTFWEDYADGGQVLFTAQEGGSVLQIDVREDSRQRKLLQRTTSNGIAMSVRTIAMPPSGTNHSPHLLTLGGDGPDVEIYDLRALSSSSSPMPVAVACPAMLNGSADLSPNLSVSSLVYSKHTTELLANYQSSMAFTFEDPLSGQAQDSSGYKTVYGGHVNNLTVLKRAVYLGPRDEYVCCGSDSGHIWIYDRHTSNVVELLYGDSEIVNGIEPHPRLPVLATYGLEDQAKIWTVGGSQRLYSSDLENLNTILDGTVDAAAGLCVYPEKEVRRVVRGLRGASRSSEDSNNSSESSSRGDPFCAEFFTTDEKGELYGMNSQGHIRRISFRPGY